MTKDPTATPAPAPSAGFEVVAAEARQLPPGRRALRVPLAAAGAALLLSLATAAADTASRWLTTALDVGQASAFAVLVCWVIVRLKNALLEALGPLLIALGYIMLLQTPQGIETVRAVNQSSVLSQVGSYTLWLLCSIHLAATLYTAAVLRQRAQDIVRTRTQVSILFLLITAPFAGGVLAQWSAASLHLAWPPDAESLVGLVLRSMPFAVGAALTTSGAALLTRHGGRRNVILREIEKHPAGVLLGLGGMSVILIQIIGWGSSEFDTSLDIPPMALLAAGCGLLASTLWFVGELGRAAVRHIWRPCLPFGVGTGSVMLLLSSWLIGFTNRDSAFVLALWFGTIGLVLVSRDWRGPQQDMPALALVLSLGVLLSLLDLNDNHELPFARTEAATPTAEASFRAWLQQPRGAAAQQIAFVVVTEGGGARAAYLTALVLEALRTRCGDFARSHFATIGVSGGSLGAALSTAAATRAADDAGCTRLERFEPAGSLPVAVAAADLLRPVLRGLLTADLPMRFFPGSLWQTAGEGELGVLQRPWVGWVGDRAQYIDWRLDLAWREAGGGKGLQDRMFAPSWPGPSGDTPALILLSTDVGSGRRIAISHLRLGEAASSVVAPGCLPPREPAEASTEQRSRLLTMAEVAPGRDPTLLGAAVASARFPLVTPAATLPCPGPRWRLVDGGYFENSGLTTALDLVEEMAQGASTAGRNVRVVLLRIENGDADAEADGPPPAWLGEMLSPVRALLGTRNARADLARRTADRAEAEGRYGRGCFDGHGLACIAFAQERLRLRACGVVVPLGWSLSSTARLEIRQQLGFDLDAGASDCVRAAAGENRAALEKIMRLARGAE